jgi:hypothetical protein
MRTGWRERWVAELRASGVSRLAPLEQSHTVRLFTITLLAAALVWISALAPRVARAQEEGSAATTEQDFAPPVRDGRPVDVKVGIYVTNLAAVDEVRERFQVNGYLAETWNDPRLAFTPESSDGELKRLRPEKLWIPDLLMINAVSPRRKVSVNIKVAPNGTVYYMEEFQVELSTEFALQAFPFDRQSLQIVLQPFLDDRDTMKLDPDLEHTGVSPDPWVPLAQWEILGLTSETRSALLGGSRNRISELEFDIAVKRRFWFYLWKVFLPLLIMAAVAYGTYWVKLVDIFTQASMALTAILTEIALLFAISSDLPRIPYLTYFDAFFLIGFFFSFIAIVEVLLVHQAVERREMERAWRIRRFTRVLHPLLYVLCNIAVMPLFITF